MPITSKSSKFKGKTQHYVVKLPKSAGTGQYGPKIGNRANLSPEFPTQFSVATYAPVVSCENTMNRKCEYGVLEISSDTKVRDIHIECSKQFN